MGVIASITQQPDDVLDYDIDVSDLVDGGDSVASVEVAVSPAGLTATASVVDDDTVKVWLSGGTSGTAYKVEVTVTTDLGRVKQDEMRVKIKDY